MATANFEPMKYEMPLVVGGVNYQEYKQDYYDQFGTEPTEDDYFDEVQWEIETCDRYAEELNEKLRHFRVDTKGGYYAGYQFVVECTDKYWDYYDLGGMTEDDADYYYGMSKQEVINEFTNELAKIKDFLDEQVEMGMTELKRYATFSNGETLYQLA